ncbi:hypothetical protein ACFP9V_18755 [Deinococcus radiopugnans]
MAHNSVLDVGQSGQGAERAASGAGQMLLGQGHGLLSRPTLLFRLHDKNC